ncbi:hypothetical protein BC834DRAFT_246509 [Gloeopeniophorella convolvens]|nr:hypothetical protein BC834DRAFT_246509 [Gloeopeniophorella convolvens]
MLALGVFFLYCMPSTNILLMSFMPFLTHSERSLTHPTFRLAHHPGALAGLAIGSTATIVALSVLLFFLIQRRRIRRLEHSIRMTPTQRSPLGEDEMAEMSGGRRPVSRDALEQGNWAGSSHQILASDDGLLDGPASAESGLTRSASQGHSLSMSGHALTLAPNPATGFGFDPESSGNTYQPPPSSYPFSGLEIAARSPPSTRGHSTSDLRTSSHGHGTSSNGHGSVSDARHDAQRISVRSDPELRYSAESEGHGATYSSHDASGPASSFNTPGRHRAYTDPPLSINVVPPPPPSQSAPDSPRSIGRGSGPAFLGRSLKWRLRGGLGSGSGSGLLSSGSRSRPSSSISGSNSTPLVTFFESPEAAEARRRSQTLASPPVPSQVPLPQRLADLLPRGQSGALIPPSPAESEVGVPDGLLHPRLTEGGHSVGTLSLRDDVDYSRPVAARMYSQVTIATTASQDTDRRAPTVDEEEEANAGLHAALGNIYAHSLRVPEAEEDADEESRYSNDDRPESTDTFGPRAI